MTGPGPAEGLAHGLRGDLVPPDWPPLTGREVRALLRAYGIAREPGRPARILWTSPRPTSAAGVVSAGKQPLFLKRHSVLVRTAGQLRAEHAFGAWLRRRGVPVPAVVATPGGATTVEVGEWVYELHQLAGGADIYRDAMSWTPYRNRAHARAAGRALARLHLAAAGYDAPVRPPAVLMDSCALISADAPRAALEALVAARPRLSAYLSGRDWGPEVDHALGRWMDRAASADLAREPPLWTHGDWHPSNLAWAEGPGGSEVAAVFDLGLCNRTFALHDLAVAVERACITWLDEDSAGADGVQVDWDGLGGLLSGYGEILPLDHRRRQVLAVVLPVAHVEFALSEVEYYAGIVRSAANADLAYHAYLLGHARWFQSDRGRELLDHLGHGATS